MEPNRFIDVPMEPEVISLSQDSTMRLEYSDTIKDLQNKEMYGFAEYKLQFITPRVKILNKNISYPIFLVTAPEQTFIVDQVGCSYENLLPFFEEHYFTLMHFCHSKKLKVNDCYSLLNEVKRAFPEKRNASGTVIENDMVLKVCEEIYKNLGLTFEAEVHLNSEPAYDNTFTSILKIVATVCGPVSLFPGSGIFGSVALAISGGCYIIVGGYELYNHWKNNKNLMSLKAVKYWLNLIGGMASLTTGTLGLAIGLVPGMDLSKVIEGIVTFSEVAIPIAITVAKFVSFVAEWGMKISPDDIKKLFQGKGEFKGSVIRALLNS